MTININNNPAFCGVERVVASTIGKGGQGSATSVLSNLPKGIEIKNPAIGAFLKKVNRNVSSPEQRLIMGVTALFSQPFIDLNNNRVNEETRLMSFSRTLSKIIVGTTVGVLVRKGCIKAVDKYAKMKVFNAESLGAQPARAATKAFLSPEYVNRYTKDYHRNYTNALGSVLGILVSVFTNFIIDAPLTQILTNKIYKKVTDNPSHDKQSTDKQSYNLLKAYLINNQTSHSKAVSFSGLEPIDKLARKAARKAQKVAKAAEKAAVLKAEEQKLSNEYGSRLTTRIRFWKWFSKDPGGALMHTGALGWAASSAAQITGLAFNDKIDSDKKKFLIPQEFADAVANIGLYYLLTVSVKKYVESLFESGKIRIKSVMDKIDRNAQEKRDILGKNFHLGNIFAKDGKSVASKLEKLTSARNAYLAHKNGASILATLFASVISCNILTPYLRNIYGSYRQDMTRAKSAKINAKLFDMKQKSQSQQLPPAMFNAFMVK